MQLYHDSELGQHEAHTAETMRFVQAQRSPTNCRKDDGDFPHICLYLLKCANDTIGLLKNVA